MADVSATLPAWSTTRSSNAPSGSTPIGTGLDDNLREIQGVVRGWLASQGAAITAASTTDLGAVEGVYHTITGATAITSFGTVAAGIWKMLRFASTPLITYNATSLILPTSASITAEAGDTMLVISEGSGNWRCIQYTRATGLALVASGGGGGGGTSGFSTGDVKGTIKLAADPGWVMMNDGTIGDASSGATTRANADCAALFALVWTAVVDGFAPVSGGRGASGAADFAAHKSIALPKALGRALCASGSGAGLIAKSHGGTAGADTATADLAPHQHFVPDPQHTHPIQDNGHVHFDTATFTASNSLQRVVPSATATVGVLMGTGDVDVPYTPTGTVAITPNSQAANLANYSMPTGINYTDVTGSGGGHNNLQPSLFINWMICL